MLVYYGVEAFVHKAPKWLAPALGTCHKGHDSLVPENTNMTVVSDTDRHRIYCGSNYRSF